MTNTRYIEITSCFGCPYCKEKRARYRSKFIDLYESEEDAKIARDLYMEINHV